MKLCDHCEGRYRQIYDVAKAEGYKAGYYEGFQVFMREIADAKSMRPVVIHIHKLEKPLGTDFITVAREPE